MKEEEVGRGLRMLAAASGVFAKCVPERKNAPFVYDGEV